MRRGRRLSGEPDRPAFIEHQRDRAEQLGSIAERSRNDLNVLAGRWNDPMADRIAHRRQQHLAARTNAAANDDPLWIDKVAEVCKGTADVAARVADRALAPGVAVCRPLENVLCG